MMKVIFSFRGAGIQGKVQEEVEFDDDTTENDIEHAFVEWLFSNSDATWWFADGRERET